MNEYLGLIVAAMTGLGIGGIFFGGLWWTIRRGAASPRPVLWFLGSATLRMGLALLGFYLVASTATVGMSLQHLLVSLLGFVAARLAVSRVTRLSPQANDVDDMIVAHPVSELESNL